MAMSSPIEPEMTIRPSPRATYRKLADGSGGVLLHLDTAAYHGLNEVGALVWSIIEPGVTFEVLMSRLEEEFEDAPASLRGEMEEFLRSLEDRGLVRIGASHEE
jgi:hypothetical protein